MGVHVGTAALTECGGVWYEDMNGCQHQIRRLLTSQPTLLRKEGQGLGLYVEGTIPITHRGNRYYIPVRIVLPYNFPEAPIVNVVPAANMVVKVNHPNVSDNGKVDCFPYLVEWNRRNSSLSELVRKMQETFGNNCPLGMVPGFQPNRGNRLNQVRPNPVNQQIRGRPHRGHRQNRGYQRYVPSPPPPRNARYNGPAAGHAPAAAAAAAVPPQAGKPIHFNIPEGNAGDNLEINDLTCPLSKDILVDPVVGSDGHTYERYYIQMHFNTSRGTPKSPITHEIMTRTLLPNHAVKKLIDTIYREYDKVKNGPPVKCWTCEATGNINKQRGGEKNCKRCDGTGEFHVLPILVEDV